MREGERARNGGGHAARVCSTGLYTIYDCVVGVLCTAAVHTFPREGVAWPMANMSMIDHFGA